MSRRAVFTGVARDCAAHLPGVLENLGRFAALTAPRPSFSWSATARDDTRAILERWLADGRRGRVIDLGVLEGRLPQRTERIAFARNTGLDEIAGSEDAGHDHLVVADLDDVLARPVAPTASPVRRPGSMPIRRAPASWPMPCRATTTSGRCATSAGARTIAGIRSGAARPTRPSKRQSSAKSSPARSRSRRRCRRLPYARPSAGLASIACLSHLPPATAASTRKAARPPNTSPSTARSAAPAASFTSFRRCRCTRRASISTSRRNSSGAGAWPCWRGATAEIARPSWRQMLAADMKALIIDPAVHSLGGHHFNAVQRLQDELRRTGRDAPCLGSAYADRRVVEELACTPTFTRSVYGGLRHARRVRRQRRGDRPATGAGDAPVRSTPDLIILPCCDQVLGDGAGAAVEAVLVSRRGPQSCCGCSTDRIT